MNFSERRLSSTKCRRENQLVVQAAVGIAEILERGGDTVDGQPTRHHGIHGLLHGILIHVGVLWEGDDGRDKRGNQ